MSARVPAHSELQEMLGAYALDALDPDERALLDEHLPSCPRCRAEVAEHRETAALLAFAGQDAPPGVWDRISASLEEPPPPIDLRLARRRWRPTGLVTAAAVVISVLALGIAIWGRDRGRSTDRPDVAAPRIHLASVDGRHSADIVVRDGRGWVFNDNLPALPDGEVYQLWGKRGADLISLGLLGRDPEQEQFVAAGEFEAYAITAEHWPGVVTSHESPVVAGTTA